MSSVAFVGHHCAFRYVPREVSLASFWILSVADMYVCRSWRRCQIFSLFSFICLHPRGRFHVASSGKARWAVVVDCSAHYYTVVVDGCLVSVIFFSTTWWFWSISTQLWITVGSMISIAIGYSAMLWREWIYHLRRTPGVPVPVMTYMA